MSTLVSNTIKPRRGDTVTFADCNISVGGTATYEDVTNIDSIGIITARSDIKVSGIVTAMTGTAVTYHGDGSKLTGIESGVENFVASGTIDNGKTVVLNTNGTVGIVTQTTSDTPSIGSSVVWSSASVYYVTSTYDTINNKIVIVYVDNDDSNNGKAVVGTVSGTDISFGTPVTFNGGTWSTDWTKVAYDPDQGKIVIAYQDAPSGHGTAIVGTVIGTATTFGTEVLFKNATIADPAIIYDTTNDKVVVIFKDQGNNNYGTARVGTVAGLGITFTGPDGVFASGNSGYYAATFDSDNSRVVIAYQDTANNSYGKAVVGTVTGVGITFGDGVVFNSGTTWHPSTAYVGSGKVVIAYRDSGNNNYGTARVGTIDTSDNSISFDGPEVLFGAGPSYPASASYISVVYDTTSDRVVISYQDNDSSGYCKAVVGTVVGTGITFGTPQLVSAGDSYYITSSYDPDQGKIVIAYAGAGGGNDGISSVLNAVDITTNLTTENYIGISAETISDTSTGKVNVLGGVNSGQSGLTTAQTYYVAQTGILTTTADTPSVVAGTSMSSTEILIR